MIVDSASPSTRASLRGMRRWLQSPNESEVEGEPSIPVKPTQLVNTPVVAPQKGKQSHHKGHYLQLIVLSSDDETPNDATANDTDPVIRNRRQISRDPLLH